MPSIRRVLETALYCDDLNRTAAFYQRLLDVAPMVRSERLAAFPVGDGSVLLVFQRGESEQPLSTAGGTVPPHDGSGPVHVAFAIDGGELEAWDARLASLGIAIESRVEWPRGGRSLYFRDPDGRSVELATPGIWPTY